MFENEILNLYEKGSSKQLQISEKSYFSFLKGFILFFTPFEQFCKHSSNVVIQERLDPASNRRSSKDISTFLEKVLT